MKSQLIFANSAIKDANNLLITKRKADDVKLKDNKQKIRETIKGIKVYRRLLKAETMTDRAYGVDSVESKAIHNQRIEFCREFASVDAEIFNLMMTKQQKVAKRMYYTGVVGVALASCAGIISSLYFDMIGMVGSAGGVVGSFGAIITGAFRWLNRDSLKVDYKRWL